VFETQVASSVEAPTCLRGFTRSVLAAWELETCSAAVELLVTELVANVVVHVGSPVTVRLSRPAGRIRVEVDDASPALPELEHPGLEETHGRGILLVTSLASRWGAEGHDGGKTVWFEIDDERSDRSS
jgi:anti-sigma regulatory factor (Ser/Thr protein kinase)